MRSLRYALWLVLAASLPSVAQLQPSPTSSGTELDAKTKKEVVEMEQQLMLAIKNRDTAALDALLVDYYADAYEGSRKGKGKPWAMARCKAGKPTFLALEQQQLSRNANIVTIEGLSTDQPRRGGDITPGEQPVRVRRLWTKKDGRWLLIFQVRGLIKEAKPEVKEK